MVSFSASSIRFRVRFSGVLGEAEVERVSDIETELLAMLPAMEVSGLAETCEFPERIELLQGEVLVYGRDPAF